MTHHRRRFSDQVWEVYRRALTPLQDHLRERITDPLGDQVWDPVRIRVGNQSWDRVLEGINR